MITVYCKCGNQVEVEAVICSMTEKKNKSESIECDDCECN